MERPLVFYLDPDEDATASFSFCHECFSRVRTTPVPCPGCSRVAFCSLGCRRRSWSRHHGCECRIHHLLRDTGLNRHCLVMLALRAVTQRTPHFLTALAQHHVFGRHDVRWSAAATSTEATSDDDLGEDESGYRTLFCLLTHEDRRQDMDVATKTVLSVFLLECLRASGYFGHDEANHEVVVVVVGRLLLHFLLAFQFNTHMIEGVYSNRLISGHDSETRIWKETSK